MNNYLQNVIWVICLSIAFKSFGGIHCQAQTTDQPNIIFLLTDDQRFDALGCMGNTEIQTPEIDKLAEQGTLFMNHYNPTAICMGARAVIMTGMYEHKTGCNFQHGPLTKAKFQKSYPVLLRDAGYYTGFAGKFGYAVSENATDPSTYKSNDVMPMAEFDWWRGWPEQGSYKTVENEFMAEYADEYPHVSKALGAAAVDFIELAQTQSKPFCLSVSFKAPHGPVSPDPNYDHIYDGQAFTPPDNYWMDGAAHLPDQPKLGRQYMNLGNHWEPNSYNASLAKYYRLVYGVDVAVGMLMDQLEADGLMDNTIIIFTTDNGYFCGSHAMGGKVLPYEEGSRAPLIIYDPGSTMAGEVIEPLTGNHDMAPTILDYAGIAIPDNMDGVSLKPLMDGTQTSVKQHQMVVQAWGSNPTHALTVLQDNYKYMYWFYGGLGLTPQEEMYDLDNDPEEMNNLVSDPLYSAQLEIMRELYDSYVDQWKLDCVDAEPKNNYKEYGILYDRHKPWSDKTGIMKASRDPEIPTTIELPEQDVDLKVYPNPVKDQFSITLDGSKSSNVSIDLFDLKGRYITKLFNGNSSELNTQTFISQWPAGMYLLQFNIDGVYHSEHLIVQ
ncbi:sulfatase-like hydrolase/transferase [Carboxylicivirga marina]|uniref:Sulfatase-like hydrolase/transferase n=1 Tax=Carboxylicivirga marina TaxID=2800988 RepID=A0ABS1HIQ3_9BACT|nr:sulfatase-like hydrolase/transferase [Carboxylicivirga marina]MBK3517529.1 sulfatase-like hydrolase/transferase [Carboxylicivirga marina]